MALGKRQKEDLARIVELCTKPMSEGYMRVEVWIGKWRSSREVPIPGGYARLAQRGIAITVTPIECYPEPGFEQGEYPMAREWIADCQYAYTAFAKGQEIARYLVEQGVPRERVKLTKR